MVRAWTRWRAGGLVTAAGALVVLLANGPAQAQCVGDCGSINQVLINNLVTGVNIVFGSLPVSACPEFENAEGQVDIAQLVTGVNNALDGCPPLGSHVCTLVPGVTASRLELSIAAVAMPIPLTMSGSTRITCGSVDVDGKAECTCEIISIDPINLPGVGVLCITPTSEPCPPAPVDCDGGTPLNVDLLSDGNIGMCEGNAACAGTCDTACAAEGRVRLSSGCTGYCSMGTMQVCTSDAQCAQADSGSCNGPNTGLVPDICQCSCVNTAAGGEGRKGEAQCYLGATLTVEAATGVLCDGQDVTIDVGSLCIPQTTSMAQTLIINANGGDGTVPRNGATGATGVPVTCGQFASGDLTGLQVRGAANFFGSTLGDIANIIYAQCE